MTDDIYGWQRLTSAADPDFAAFHRIYRASLPARERKSRAQLAAMVEQPSYLVLLLKDAAGVAGFGVVYVSEGERFALLEYLAVAGDRRGAGLGSRLFRACMAEVRARYGAWPMLIEVDSEREDSADRALRLRRKRFYRALGCRDVQGLDYLLPLPGKGPAPRMDLMLCAEPLPAAVDKAELGRWLQDIYVTVYGRKPDDRRLERMLAPLDSAVSLA